MKVNLVILKNKNMKIFIGLMALVVFYVVVLNVGLMFFSFEQVVIGSLAAILAHISSNEL